jgi:hypothetical protein
MYSPRKKKPSRAGSHTSAIAVQPSALRRGRSQVPSRMRMPARKLHSGSAKAATPNQVWMNWWLISAPNLPSQFSARILVSKIAPHERLVRSWSMRQVNRKEVKATTK